MQGGFGVAPKLTYEGYLEVRKLLALQHPQSSPTDRDELLFIIVHQVHELWFKLILHELDQAIHVLETMSSSDFLRFRDHLNPASGFQSAQFRELEYVWGHKRANVLDDHQGESRARLERRLAAPSLEDAFYGLLAKEGFAVPPRGSAPEPERTKKAVQALLPIYKQPDENAALFDLAEAFVSMDEQLSLWRLHHVTMVERMIGNKTGTGGSAGVAYLLGTTKARAFPDLWALRTELTPGY